MRRYTVLTCATMAPALAGCALASATAGAAISVTATVVATGVHLTGKTLDAGIDALTASPEADDSSGIVIRERIRTEPPAVNADAAGDS